VMTAREPLINGLQLSDTVRLNGTQLKLWNDEHFSRLRKKHGVPDHFLDRSRKSVDFKHVSVNTTFGKGGEAQYTSEDGQFIVKSVSGVEHASLLEQAEGYVERVLNGSSLLVPIYLHFESPVNKKHFMAMRNITPEAGYWQVKYDLKGCDDDKTIEQKGQIIIPVRKRFYHLHRWFSCLWTQQRWEYWRGKDKARNLQFSLAPEFREAIVNQVAGDADWLTERGLMDYSLFVAVREIPKEKLEEELSPFDPTADSMAFCPPRFAMKKDDKVLIVHVAIIDFLQPWTNAKRVAECIKMLEYNKATVPPKTYGRRFKAHFKKRLQADNSYQALSSEVARAASNVVL